MKKVKLGLQKSLRGIPARAFKKAVGSEYHTIVSQSPCGDWRIGVKKGATKVSYLNLVAFVEADWGVQGGGHLFFL